MSSEILKRDANNEPVVGFVTDDSAQDIKMGRIDDTTKGMKVVVVGGVVTSINNLSGAVTLVAGSNITLTSSGNTITIASTASGTGTVTSVTSANGAATVTQSTTNPVITIVSAPILTTARTINGTSFDGSANITVTAAAGTLTGTVLNATVVSSSLTSLGTIATGVWNGNYRNLWWHWRKQ